jgi:hypothetical protein
MCVVMTIDSAPFSVHLPQHGKLRKLQRRHVWEHQVRLRLARPEYLHLPQVRVLPVLVVAQQCQLDVEAAQVLAQAAARRVSFVRTARVRPAATHCGFPSTGCVSEMKTQPVGSSSVRLATSRSSAKLLPTRTETTLGV